MPRLADRTTAQPELKLRQIVYEQIRKEIITCQLPPGVQLSEAIFAQRFNISKTPVREALTSLVQDHLVEYLPNRGFMVAPVTVRDIQEIFEARLLYETLLISIAIRNMTEEELSRLEEVSSQSYDFSDPSAAECCLQANTEFHMIIARASHNSRLIHHYQEVLDEAQRLIFMDLQKNILPYSTKIGHIELVEALRNRDEKAGQKAIEDMLSSGKKRILGLEEYA